MKDNESKEKIGQNESIGLTEADLNEFLSATGDAQWKILLAHAEKNRKIIKIRRLKTMEQYNDQNQEEISKQFEEFCHTKGISAKFKVAFANMAENTRKQKEADKAKFEEVKRQSAEANPEFTEFLHTKGFKAKVKLVIENIKKGAKENNEKNRRQIEEEKHDFYKVNTDRTFSADELTREFSEFLKDKGLDGKYSVEVMDEE